MAIPVQSDFLKKVYDVYESKDFRYGKPELNPVREMSTMEILSATDVESMMMARIKERMQDIIDETVRKQLAQRKKGMGILGTGFGMGAGVGAGAGGTGTGAGASDGSSDGDRSDNAVGAGETLLDNDNNPRLKQKIIELGGDPSYPYLMDMAPVPHSPIPPPEPLEVPIFPIFVAMPGFPAGLADSSDSSTNPYLDNGPFKMDCDGIISELDLEDGEQDDSGDGDGSGDGKGGPPVKSITVNPTSLSMMEGDIAGLKLIPSPSNANLSGARWTSDCPGVSVSKTGLKTADVVAISEGVCHVCVTVGDYEECVEVTVSADANESDDETTDDMVNNDLDSLLDKVHNKLLAQDFALFQCAAIELGFLRVILAILKVIKVLKIIVDMVLALLLPIIAIVQLAVGAWLNPSNIAKIVQLIVMKVISMVVMLITMVIQMLWNLLNLDCIADTTQKVIDEIKACLSGLDSIFGEFNGNFVATTLGKVNSKVLSPLAAIADQVRDNIDQWKHADDAFNDMMKNLSAEELKATIQSAMGAAISPFASRITGVANNAKSLVPEAEKLKEAIKGEKAKQNASKQLDKSKALMSNILKGPSAGLNSPRVKNLRTT